MVRWLKWIPVLLFAVVVGAGGSLWAHQVIADRLAHSSYAAAVVTLTSDIQAARRAGLLPSEIQSYSKRLAGITNRRTPGDGTFWGGATAGFYAHQNASLKSADKSLRMQLARATDSARITSQKLLRRFSWNVRVAKTSGLDPKRFTRQMDAGLLNFRRSSSVGEYRELIGALRPQLRAIHAIVGQRRAALSWILWHARKSGDALQTVRQLIDARTTAAKNELSLLRQFGAYPSLSKRLVRISSWALARPHLRKAAVGAADVGVIAGQIHSSLVSVAPAKWILVSTENETIEWFQGPNEIGSSLATTGNPQLPTATGHFTILAKFSPFTFVSEDPIGSPFYYPPSPVNYAMEFQNTGFYIHDAPWRSVFGPGTNGPGQPGTNYGGSHGCVNVPLDVAAFLFGWAPMGTPVIVD